ncbi:MAG TPA: alkaline phosphatase family protein [Agriterribacter sp.]|nr:alkaline phosphatase family protein [Agriterribacter sp.]
MRLFFQLSFGVTLLFFSGSSYGRVSNAGVKDTTMLRTILVIFDGLRPDYITSDWMPNLYAFSKKAAVGKDNHSVFPTVTRVNAASYVTGAYPSAHGLMGNSIYLPEINRKASLNTGNAGNLRHIMTLTSGKLLTAPSLGEILKTAGEEMFVYSSGTTGQAFLQNHTANGAVINPDLILPKSFRSELAVTLGPPPEEATPNKARHQWITDALCHYTLTSGGPLVSAIWFSDPDGTAHKNGIGVPSTIAALQDVDLQFGRIIDSIRVRGLEPFFNIVVTADHGFITHQGKTGLRHFLIEQGLKKRIDADDVVVADGAVYVKGHDPESIRRIVTTLQEQEWVGAIFTKAVKPGSMQGSVKGTLSFESIHWNHPQRAADILVAVNWNNRKDSLGNTGIDFAEGKAGHGGSSTYEIRIPLMAYGPSFKQGIESKLPTSNIDIVPTILHIHQISQPQQIQGRVMFELLKSSSAKPLAPKKEMISSEAILKEGKYRVMLERTLLGKNSYINSVRVIRVKNTK